MCVGIGVTTLSWISACWQDWLMKVAGRDKTSGDFCAPCMQQAVHT
jgi:hypothetical protein